MRFHRRARQWWLGVRDTTRSCSSSYNSTCWLATYIISTNLLLHRRRHHRRHRGRHWTSWPSFLQKRWTTARFSCLRRHIPASWRPRFSSWSAHSAPAVRCRLAARPMMTRSSVWTSRSTSSAATRSTFTSPFTKHGRRTCCTQRSVSTHQLDRPTTRLPAPPSELTYLLITAVKSHSLNIGSSIARNYTAILHLTEQLALYNTHIWLCEFSKYPFHSDVCVAYMII